MYRVLICSWNIFERSILKIKTNKYIKILIKMYSLQLKLALNEVRWKQNATTV